MTGERPYPDDAAGPFPEPPLSFADAEGRTIDLRALGRGGDGDRSDDRTDRSDDCADAAAGDRADRGDGVGGGGTADAAAGDRAPAGPAEVEGDDVEGDEMEALVDMYGRFDPADRAQGIPPAREDRVRRWLDSILDDSLDVVAWHGDEIVGHATLVPDDAGAWELAIFVLDEYQGAGIGTRLLEALLGHGRAREVERVWLTVERWNRPAISLYRKVGFETCSAESFEMEMSLRLQ